MRRTSRPTESSRRMEKRRREPQQLRVQQSFFSSALKMCCPTLLRTSYLLLPSKPMNAGGGGGEKCRLKATPGAVSNCQPPPPPRLKTLLPSTTPMAATHAGPPLPLTFHELHFLVDQELVNLRTKTRRPGRAAPALAAHS